MKLKTKYFRLFQKYHKIWMTETIKQLWMMQLGEYPYFHCKHDKPWWWVTLNGPALLGIGNLFLLSSRWTWFVEQWRALVIFRSYAPHPSLAKDRKLNVYWYYNLLSIYCQFLVLRNRSIFTSNVVWLPFLWSYWLTMFIVVVVCRKRLT